MFAFDDDTKNERCTVSFIAKLMFGRTQINVALILVKTTIFSRFGKITVSRDFVKLTVNLNMQLRINNNQKSMCHVDKARSITIYKTIKFRK